ncbi:hypothetical protein J6590_054736 [Homalodisca vitripennis]|nr:hypothetical protein J6590_054736 [Homalodisca vitripennis]
MKEYYSLLKYVFRTLLVQNTKCCHSNRIRMPMSKPTPTPHVKIMSWLFSPSRESKQLLVVYRSYYTRTILALISLLRLSAASLSAQFARPTLALILRLSECPCGQWPPRHVLSKNDQTRQYLPTLCLQTLPIC